VGENDINTDTNDNHPVNRRIQCTDVTDTLLRAMDHADELENVLVIAWRKGKGTMMLSDHNITVCQANMLLAIWQHQLLVFGDEEDGR
jgi:streptomycin 6-kinase